MFVRRSLTLGFILATALATACGSVASKDPDASVTPTPDATVGGPDAMVGGPDAAEVDAGVTACTPSTTTCSSGTLVVCDSNGDIQSQSGCSLGCFDTNRCNKLDPSNNMAVHLDNAEAQSGVTFSGTATINTSTGSISDGSGSLSLSTAFDNSQAVDVFIIRVGSLVAQNINVTGSRALAIVADGSIAINGKLDVSASASTYGAGSHTTDSACVGKNGNSGAGWTGGGGGAFGGAGGRGGLAGTVIGGLGGTASGNTTLTPLRGGCRGGSSGGGTISGSGGDFEPGGGGGAVQLVSNTAITVSFNGDIAANGGGALGYTGTLTLACFIGQRCYPGDGGGSGGGILLEAPVVTVASGGGLFANGGGGSCFHSNHGSDGLLSTSRAQGGDCNASNRSGDGGASTASSGTNASNLGGTTSNSSGGGGGVGRIRVNQAPGVAFSPAGTVSPPATAGNVGTR